MTLQPATCTSLHVRSPQDARIIFFAVQSNILPMVTRRLDNEERQMISSGSCYVSITRINSSSLSIFFSQVWEERGPHAELTGVGIERWTDGLKWGQSRVRDGFLFYQEKRDRTPYPIGPYDSERPPSRPLLNKQTYTVFVNTPNGQRKWHLIAYFTQESLGRLKSVDDFPVLASLEVPRGSYPSARHPKGRPEHIFNAKPEGPRQFVTYLPKVSGGSEESMSSGAIIWPTASREQRYSPGELDSSESSSTCSGQDESLAPLTYLQTIPPSRRHPIDEKMMMRLHSQMS
ncbi:hypothetical protein C8J56DRAFT_437429 [Mycena floridula]|nr:hypothetical protein C8J56DRAFT_437429 [Mycena floridula]